MEVNRFAPPDESQAGQFVLMLRAGLPAEQAILYFIEIDDPMEMRKILSTWLRSRTVSRAQLIADGARWEEMSLDDRITTALEQHYSSLAYLLRSVNYLNANAVDKAKIDQAREALERKVAGTAGKGDALQQFADDLRTGKIKLNLPAKQAN